MLTICSHFSTRNLLMRWSGLSSLRILIVHPLMSAMGGGERLCCETIRAARSFGDELIVLTEDFDVAQLEGFFGYDRLFSDVDLRTYRLGSNRRVGRYEDLIRRLKGQGKILPDVSRYDLIFSTQDP